MIQEIIFVDKDTIPPDYVYDTETKHVWVYRNKYTGEEIQIAKVPPLYVKAVPIPDDATNGDIIKTMFSDATVQPIYGTFNPENLLGYRVYLGGRPQEFLLDWWNAPYKEKI